MTFRALIHRMASNPKQLFLIDSLGALLSAFFLGFILVKFESTFGMPSKVLYYLAAILCGFAVYSFMCYWRTKENWRPFLRGIAIANTIYCGISIVLVFHFYSKLTNLGLVYFLLEFAIVLSLVSIEFRTAAESTK